VVPSAPSTVAAALAISSELAAAALLDAAPETARIAAAAALNRPCSHAKAQCG